MKQMNFSDRKNETNTSIYFGMGLVVALSLFLFAFEWSSNFREAKVYTPGNSSEVIEIDFNVKLPEPPKPKIELPEPASPDELIVKDDPVKKVQLATVEDDASKPQGTIFRLPEPPAGSGRVEEEAVLEFAEISPAFIGGSSALMSFLSETVRYPHVDIEQGVEGRVICTFVVEKDGSITDIEVVRGVSPNIDKEAKRVIAAMPKWKPGFQNGNTVRVKFTLPIVFKLSK